MAEGTDPLKELEAMRAVAEALAGLDSDSTRRVLGWALERFGVSATQASRGASSVPGHHPAGDPALQDLPDLFAIAQPSDGPAKALLAGYWLQAIKGNEDIEAQTLNSELKHLGHRLPNVTSTLSLLMNQKPALVVQTRKTGSNQQARKRYRLTSEGIRRVRQLLTEGSGSSSNPL